MVPVLPDFALGPSYASLPVTGPSAQMFVATPLNRWNMPKKKIRPIGHLEPVVMGCFFFVPAPCLAVSVDRTVRSGELTPAGGQRPSGDRGIPNTAERFIESSFNACLKLMFRQVSRTTVT